jgi:hypothetical protein
LSRNLGTLNSWNPLGPSGPVTGLLYLLLQTNPLTYFENSRKKLDRWTSSDMQSQQGLHFFHLLPKVFLLINETLMLILHLTSTNTVIISYLIAGLQYVLNYQRFYTEWGKGKAIPVHAY